MGQFNQGDLRVGMQKIRVQCGQEAALAHVLENVSNDVSAAFEIGLEYCGKTNSHFAPQADSSLSDSSLSEASDCERLRFLAEQIVVESEYCLQDCPAVIETTAAQASSLDFERLLNGPALALVIRDLVEPARAQAIAHALASSKLESGYDNLRDDLSKIGHTLFEAVSSQRPDAIADYLARARHFERLLTEITADIGGSPMIEAKEVLNRFGAASVLPLQNSTAFAGLVRIVHSGTEILPHQDDLTEDLPGHPFVSAIQATGGGQLAGNIYLQVPPTGGELVIWDLHLCAEEMAARQIAGSDYGVDPKTLPKPAVVIKPQAGSLILFDSTKMHAVTKPADGLRVSYSFFVGSSPDRIIHFWS